MPSRRNPVKGWSEVMAWVVAAATGLAVGFAPATGGNPGWALLLVALSVPVVWLGASTSSLILLLSAGTTLLAVIFWSDPLVIVIAFIGAILGITVRFQHRNWAWVRSLVTGIIVISWTQIDIGGGVAYGAETLAAISVITPGIVSGLARRRRSQRRRVYMFGAGYLTVMLMGIGGAGVAVSQALDPARAAIDTITDIETAVADGDLDAVRQALDAARSAIANVNHELTRPWTRIGLVTPVVAHHLRYAHGLSSLAEAELSELSRAVGLIDLNSVSAGEGRVDLEAVADLKRPVDLVRGSLRRIATRLDTLEEGWVLKRITTEVNARRSDLDTASLRVERLAHGLDLAEIALGSDRPMRYFVAFTTPAEARGFSGFMGAYAEVLVEAGQVTVVSTGGTGRLEGGPIRPADRVLDPDSPILANYGRYGFDSGPGGTIQVSAWSNITMPPHLPTVADAIWQLYPQSGGAPIDGVIVMDPFVLQSLIGLSGQVRVPELDVTLTGSTTAPFLTAEMYELREAENIPKDEIIALVGGAAIDSALNSGLRQPVELAQLLGDHGRERRFGIWFAPDFLSGAPDPGASDEGLTTADINELLESAGVSGVVPRSEGRDGFGMVIQNAAPNKADIYLDRTYEHRYRFDEITGALTGTTTITITNRLNPDNVAAVVAGNAFGDPNGSARLIISFLTRLRIDRAQIALGSEPAESLPMSQSTEEGWQRWLTGAIIPPNGGSVRITLDMSGQQVPGEFAFVSIPQPLITPEFVVLEVTDRDGEILLAQSGEIREVTVMRPDPGRASGVE
jgi:hypothetical protein